MHFVFQKMFVPLQCVWETVCKYIMPTCIHRKTIKQNVRKCYDIFRKHCNEVEKRYYTLRLECKYQKIIQKDTNIDSTEITINPNKVEENDAVVPKVLSPSNNSITFSSLEISDVPHNVKNDAPLIAANCLPSVTSNFSGSCTSRDKIRRDSPISLSRKKIKTDFFIGGRTNIDTCIILGAILDRQKRITARMV